MQARPRRPPRTRWRGCRFLSDGVRLIADRLAGAVTPVERQHARSELDALRRELVAAACLAPDVDALELGVATAAVRWRALGDVGLRLSAARHREIARAWLARSRAVAVEEGLLDAFLDAYGTGAGGLASLVGDDAAARGLAEELLERVRARRVSLDPADPYAAARKVEIAAMARLAKKVLTRVSERAVPPR